MLSDRELNSEPFIYPHPQHFIGKDVYWKNGGYLNEWNKYVVAGIQLEQSLNEDGSIFFPSRWEYILADPTGLGNWNIQERTYGQSYPTCQDLISVEEYQQILAEWEEVDEIIEEFSLSISNDPDSEDREVIPSFYLFKPASTQDARCCFFKECLNG